MDHSGSTLLPPESPGMDHAKTGSACCGIFGGVDWFTPHHLATISSDCTHRSHGKSHTDPNGRIHHQLRDGKSSVRDMGSRNDRAIQSQRLVLDAIHEIFEWM